MKKLSFILVFTIISPVKMAFSDEKKSTIEIKYDLTEGNISLFQRKTKNYIKEILKVSQGQLNTNNLCNYNSDNIKFSGCISFLYDQLGLVKSISASVRDLDARSKHPDIGYNWNYKLGSCSDFPGSSARCHPYYIRVEYPEIHNPR